MNIPVNSQPPAAGEAAHTLLPEYKATDGARYHIAQRVVTDSGVKIWREIATFNDSERRNEVLRACNSHAALVAHFSALLRASAQAGVSAIFDENNKRIALAEMSATLAAAKEGQP